jgi:hypothetical protein
MFWRPLTQIALISFAIGSLASRGTFAESTVIRGWLSDEGCASGRAQDGRYTGTNPECAKKCVHDGKKIVLIDPERKRLLVISNQDAAVERVGDYVEIKGDLDEQAKTLRIDSLKLLEKGRAMCDVPSKKKS